MDRRKLQSSPSTGVVARKCGVKFNPPALVLLYRDGIKGKQRRRSIPLRKFTTSTNISTYIEELLDGRNKIYLNSIPHTQLFSLLERIKLGLKCGGSDEKGKLVQSSLPPPPLMKSLNMASVSHPAAATKSANELNEDLQLLLNLNDDSTQEDSSGSEKKEIPPLKKLQSTTLRDPKEKRLLPVDEPRLAEQQSKKESEEGNVTDHSEEISLDSDKMQDLNKLATTELDQKKSEMDVLFETNRIKPGDPNYQYDLEMDFGLGKVESGWDSNHSQSDF